MTKKDYEALAKVMREVRLSVFTNDTDLKVVVAFQEGKLATLKAFEKELVRLLKADNPRFDAGRFEAAVAK